MKRQGTRNNKNKKVKNLNFYTNLTAPTFLEVWFKIFFPSFEFTSKLPRTPFRVPSLFFGFSSPFVISIRKLFTFRWHGQFFKTRIGILSDRTSEAQIQISKFLHIFSPVFRSFSTLFSISITFFTTFFRPGISLGSSGWMPCCWMIEIAFLCEQKTSKRCIILINVTIVIIRDVRFPP